MTIATAVGPDRGYQDPKTELDELNDPLERAAILLHRFTFATVPDAVSLFSSPSGRDELVYSWRAQDQATRQLYRRRADAVLAIHDATQP